jgi:hypothetical protein
MAKLFFIKVKKIEIVDKNITLINSISEILTNISPICFEYYRNLLSD